MLEKPTRGEFKLAFSPKSAGEMENTSRGSSLSSLFNGTAEEIPQLAFDEETALEKREQIKAVANHAKVDLKMGK